MPVSEQIYEQVALEDPDGQWELHCGSLRQKPAMTFEHNDLAIHLGVLLQNQLDRRVFRVRVNSARTRRSAGSFYIPDVCVIPLAAARHLRGRMDVLEMYDTPLPLVVEVWSPSTGDYDVEDKFPEYQRRGDLEIWRIHPYDQTLTRWLLQPDSTYIAETITSGAIRLTALPEVTIAFASLFE